MFYSQKEMRPTAATIRRTKRSHQEQQNLTISETVKQLMLDDPMIAFAILGASALLAFGLIELFTHAMYWFVVNVQGNPHGWAV